MASVCMPNMATHPPSSPTHNLGEKGCELQEPALPPKTTFNLCLQVVTHEDVTNASTYPSVTNVNVPTSYYEVAHAAPRRSMSLFREVTFNDED